MTARPEHDLSADKIAARVIEQIMSVCQGVHIMAVGWEQRIPEVLRAAGIRPAPEG